MSPYREKRSEAALFICNVYFQVTNFIPIILPNLTKYDAHLFIKELSLHGDKIDITDENKERMFHSQKNYLCMIWNKKVIGDF